MINISESDIMKKWNAYSDVMVSIKCTAYNHERYMEQALDSFLVQVTNFPFEIIVHDDKSTDGTLAIIKRYVVKYPNIIKMIDESENLYSQGKTGLITYKMDKIAKGKYIALCEGDDFWSDENKLQMQFDTLENHPECSVVFSKTRYVTIDGADMGETIPWKGSKICGIFDLKDFIVEQFGDYRWTVHTSSFFYRSLYADEMREQRENQFKNYPYGDITIVLFLLLKGNGFLVDRVQTSYRYLSGGYNSTIRVNVEKNIHDLEMLCEGLGDFDRQTGYIYHKFVQKRIIRAKFDIDRLRGSTNSLLERKYWKYIPMKEHLGAILESISPALYKILKGK